mmetsp:Transcript_18872/g.39633  ORF Transcript_18872/g.39633 Transcript_18872/m.39633 type:complete len:80 (-) Transcript_18872:102-341(-)
MFRRKHHILFGNGRCATILQPGNLRLHNPLLLSYGYQFQSWVMNIARRSLSNILSMATSHFIPHEEKAFRNRHYTNLSR